MMGFFAFSGVIVGNFIGQAFMSHPNYATAFERSFFQIVALVVYLATNYFMEEK